MLKNVLPCRQSAIKNACISGLKKIFLSDRIPTPIPFGQLNSMDYKIQSDIINVGTRYHFFLNQTYLTQYQFSNPIAKWCLDLNCSQTATIVSYLPEPLEGMEMGSDFPGGN